MVNFTFSGFQGRLHGTDFRINDEEKAYILPAKMLALTAYGLLKDGAREAEKIIEEFEPVFDRESYCAHIRERVYDREDGKKTSGGKIE